MSKENISKFLEAIAQNPELLEQLKDAHTPEAVVATGKAEGFDFTAAELKEYGNTAAVPSGELNDFTPRELAQASLENVTGGVIEDPWGRRVACEYAYTCHCNEVCHLYGTWACMGGHYLPEYELRRTPSGV